VNKSLISIFERVFPRTRLGRTLAGAGIFLAAASGLRAAELEASDGAPNDQFGYWSSLSGSIGLVGAYQQGASVGSVYVFRGLDTALGSVTEAAKLRPSDGVAGDLFGYEVSLSGQFALIGSPTHDSPTTNQGAAYLYRNLATVTGTVTQSAKLTSSDGLTGDQFGTTVSISGAIGVVGANAADGAFSNQGAAYVYRGLNTATGTITETAKLTASNAGAAYVFRGLDTANGTVTQNAKLLASDGAASDLFGFKLSVSGNSALVAAMQDDDKGSNSGSVYLYRGLDTATGSVNQNAKLVASDGAASDNFGYSVSISGKVGIVGSWQDDDKGSNSGSAYLFANLDTATGTINQDVKLLASDGLANDSFGYSVSVDDDAFMIGAMRGDGVVSNSGKAYTGSVSSVTTLDAGNTARTIDGISFISRGDWTVGATTDGNSVNLTSGDSATVNVAGRSVFIGRNAGADGNKLQIGGNLVATQVQIGSIDGNTGNVLQFDLGATFNVGSLLLAEGNSLAIAGDLEDFSDVQLFLGATTLQVWNDSAWLTLTQENYADWITMSDSSGYTMVTAVPEPTAGALLITALAGLSLRRKRRQA
jgi:hypothetical protein